VYFTLATAVEIVEDFFYAQQFLLWKLDFGDMMQEKGAKKE
jgi:hypothetical protein